MTSLGLIGTQEWIVILLLVLVLWLLWRRGGGRPRAS